MIDIKAALVAYSEEIIKDIIWIRRKFNLADSATKVQISNGLMKDVYKNQLHYEIENYISKTNNDHQLKEGE